jgi:hypothetical protein
MLPRKPGRDYDNMCAHRHRFCMSSRINVEAKFLVKHVLNVPKHENFAACMFHNFSQGFNKK